MGGLWGDGMKVIRTAEGLTVHWHNRHWAVVKTYGLFSGAMYQMYRRIDKTTWERYPANGIDLFYTIRGAKEHAQKLTNERGE